VAITSEFRREKPNRATETAEERARRLEHERELIEDGLQSIRAGLYIPDEEVEAWLDLLTGDDPLPIPKKPQPKPR